VTFLIYADGSGNHRWRQAGSKGRNWLAQRLGIEQSRTPRPATPRNGHLEERAQTIRPLPTRITASASGRP
jgi:hypothetical protein